MTDKFPGSVALGDVAERAAQLEIACSRCDRRGRMNLQKLVATYGAAFPMTGLGAAIAADCPRRNEAAQGHRCDVFYPGLPAIMGFIKTPLQLPEGDDDF